MRLPEAGLFSEDPALETLHLIAEFRRQPAGQLLNELIGWSANPEGPFEDKRRGRPRMPGDWASLYLAYVDASCLSVEAFWRQLHGLLRPLLEACSFRQVPSRQAIDLRFAALEAHAEAFAEVSRELIRRARELHPRIGECIFLDGTGFSSASSLEHACEDVEWCLANGGRRIGGLRSATVDEVAEQRQRESETPEPDVDVVAESINRTRGPIITRPSMRGAVKYRAFRIRGHRFISRDRQSGVRWYSDIGKFWLGGYDQSAVDMFTGLAIAKEVFPCDIVEWDGWPSLFSRVRAATGATPRVVSIDRGFVNGLFYEFCTRRGMAVVAPFRKRKEAEQLRDRRTDVCDEHGVPRCAYCGGPGDRVSDALGAVFLKDGTPCIRFTCLLRCTNDCLKTQYLRCEADWVQLPLLSMEIELYHAVRHWHYPKEGSFNYDRQRSGLDGKDQSGRLRRSGIDAHRLRCEASILLNWFKFSLRQGLVAPVELEVARNLSDPILLSERRHASSGRVLAPGDGTPGLEKLLRHRAEQELDLPYGRAAARLREAYQARA